MLTAAEKALARHCQDSEAAWVSDVCGEVDEKALTEQEYLLHLDQRITLVHSECASLVYHSAKDEATVLPSVRWEQGILSRLAHGPMSLRQIVDAASGIARAEVVQRLQSWIAQGYLMAIEGEGDLPTAINYGGPRKHSVVLDLGGFFDQSDMSLISATLSTYVSSASLMRTQKEFFSVLDVGQEEQPSVVVLVSDDPSSFSELYEGLRKRHYSGDVLYVYPTEPLTVGMGCFRCIGPAKESLRIPCKKLQAQLGAKLRVISVLGEMYDFDHCSVLQGWARKSVLYYMNYSSGTKVKEQTICECPQIHS